MNQHVETVQSLYQAFGAGDIPKILTYLSEDVQWEHDGNDHKIPWLKPGVGIAHVQNFFASMSQFTLSRFEPQNLLAGGDQVVATIHVTLEVHATGKSFSELEAHLWTFNQQGKVCGFKHLCDTHAHWLALQA